MNKRIKKKQLSALKEKTRELIQKKFPDHELTATVTDTGNLSINQIQDMKKLFKEIGVEFKTSNRKLN